MKKSKTLNQWFWRWHVIAGLISMPFVVLLSITGAIYLFKPQVEASVIEKYEAVTRARRKAPLSLEAQLQAAQKALGKRPTSITVTKNESSKEVATAFHVGRFSHKKTAYVNPYTAEVTGTFSPKNTWMYTVRKLHGELLSGKVGSLFIELIASWLVVLILTGMYVYWPSKNRGWKGFFQIRTQKGKRTFYRDLHSVLGFWISGLLLLTLAGGLPWTAVFGESFKKVQQITNSGFSKEWMGMGVMSKNTHINAEIVSLQQMYAHAQQQNLKGEVTLHLPNSRNQGVFSVSNQTFPLNAQQKIHFDAYSGKTLAVLHWQDHVGVLMRARMWAMAFHQGQLGTWNLVLMLIVSVLLSVVSSAGLTSYLKRKREGSWSLPKTPVNFKLQFGEITAIGMLCLFLPLFGISLVILYLYQQLYSVQKIKYINLKKV